MANSFFGSFGSNVFPYSSPDHAEKTTCIGRMSLRLMISHFTNIGYTPIVGDSFTADTPLFIRYIDTKLIDIKPISELIKETKTDELGREYDTSDKPYEVLCRGGWMKPNYIYRHKTNKPIYKVKDGITEVDVTEDHSLFNENKKKIKPSEINEDTKLEYYDKPIEIKSDRLMKVTSYTIEKTAKFIQNGNIDRVPIFLLNTPNIENVKEFLQYFDGIDISNYTKTCRAGIQFLKNRLENFAN